MNRTLPLPYDTGPHDDTPSGHSFTAAWLAMFAFGALALFGLAIAAMWMVERLFA